LAMILIIARHIACSSREQWPMQCCGCSSECIPFVLESDPATRVHEDFSHGFLALLKSVHPIIMRSIHHSGTLCDRRDQQYPWVSLTTSRLFASLKVTSLLLYHLLPSVLSQARQGHIRLEYSEECTGQQVTMLLLSGARPQRHAHTGMIDIPERIAFVVANRDLAVSFGGHASFFLFELKPRARRGPYDAYPAELVVPLPHPIRPYACAPYLAGLMQGVIGQ
jgi:hypothetical protein